MDYKPADPLLAPAEAAKEAGLSISGLWKGVQSKRLPAPCYPLPRSPRWRQSILRAAVDATQAFPAEQKATRRAAKHAREALA